MAGRGCAPTPVASEDGGVRLFVAVCPPPHVIERMAALERPTAPGVGWTGPDQWHVTLRFLGEVPDPAPVERALRAVPLPAATATVGPDAEVLGRNVLVLPVAGLDGVAGAVATATAGFGQDDPRPFRGHLTLARRRRGGTALGLLGGRPELGLEATFEVAAVALVRSHLDRAGARYETLAEVPLGT
jgi:RNA 2',3'-cyclic 3'-phosphodiesterase